VRRPIAAANWKMAMTISESQAFVRRLEPALGPWLDVMDIVLCPPFTAIWAVKQARTDGRIQLGGQNMADSNDPARMGQVSAGLLLDAGCHWVVLGHWEVRRYLGDDDAAVHRKLRLALDAGLRPILLVGEARDQSEPAEFALERQLTRIVEGCTRSEVGRMVFVYEPEGSIGAPAPASVRHIAAGCGYLREWLRRGFGEAAEEARIMYGGSVSPESVPEILAVPDVDGTGGTRRGRDVDSFMGIVRQVALSRGV